MISYWNFLFHIQVVAQFFLISFHWGEGGKRQEKKRVKLILLLERHLRASALLLVHLQVCKQYVEYNR